MPFLTEAESKEAFFRRIAMYFPRLSSEYQTIEKAYYASEEAFMGQERETGDKFFTHLRATFLIQFEYLRIREPIRNSVSILHDIVEDTSWTIERVRIVFGDEIARYLSYLTKPTIEDFPGFSKEQLLQIYYIYLAGAPREVWEIKASDRFHNLVTMWNSSPEKIARKIKETKKHYLPYVEKHLILLHELEAAIESLEEELKSLKQKAS